MSDVADAIAMGSILGGGAGLLCATVFALLDVILPGKRSLEIAGSTGIYVFWAGCVGGFVALVVYLVSALT